MTLHLTPTEYRCLRLILVQRLKEPRRWEDHNDQGDIVFSLIEKLDACEKAMDGRATWWRAVAA